MSSHVFRCSSQDPSTFPWPFQKLLIVLKSKVSNRIPISLIDSQHCYLVCYSFAYWFYCFQLGEDPVGKRPDIIQIRKRRNLQWPRYLSENEAFIQFFERVADSVFPPIAVSFEFIGLYKFSGRIGRMFASPRRSFPYSRRFSSRSSNRRVQFAVGHKYPEKVWRYLPFTQKCSSVSLESAIFSRPTMTITLPITHQKVTISY